MHQQVTVGEEAEAARAMRDALDQAVEAERQASEVHYDRIYKRAS